MEPLTAHTGGVRKWFNDRWPIAVLFRAGLVEKIEGGSRFAYVLGSTTLFLFLLQVLTGTWELFYYVPTVDHAYDSVAYLRLQVPFGWLIHGLHYWGANAFVLVMGLHLVRVFIWAAYKKPRELIWLSGVLLLLLGAGLIFTGALLPWDTLGYWAGEVGTSIAGTVPGVGGFFKSLLRGGDSMGQFTLSRFFVFHTVILPALTAMVIAFHVIAFRQFGNAGPWNPLKRRRTGWFWPDQIFKDLLVVILVFLVLVGLSAYARALITVPADPLDTSYTPKPEWNFLFLYQALKVFNGPWERVGTVGIPALLVLVAVLLPFIDRRVERHPARRPVAMGLGFFFVAGILALTFAGYYSKPPELSAAASPSEAASPSTTSAAATPPVHASASDVAAGHQLFASSGCAACHTVDGVGGTLGPNLSDEAQKNRSPAWMTTQLRDSKARNANSIMPPYPSLSQPQLNELVAYLDSLSTAGKPAPAAASHSAKLPVFGKQGPPGPALTTIGSVDHGQLLYEQFCLYCHGHEGQGGAPNPGSESATVPPLKPIDRRLFSVDPAEFAANVDRFIQHGSLPAGPKPQITMPAFGDTRTLTQPQIANVEAYVLQLNGVDRAQIDHPGVEPKRFFGLCIAVFVGAGLMLGGVCFGLSRHSRAKLPKTTTEG